MSRISSIIPGCAVLVAMICVAPASAFTINFDAPTYADGEVVGQDSWTGSTGVWSVTDSASDGEVHSVVNTGAIKTISYAITSANTGLPDPNPTGTHWASLDLTLHSSSGTARLATIDFGRDGNNYKPFTLDIYDNGKVTGSYNTGSYPGPWVGFTFSGLLSDGVTATISAEIDYDNLLVKLYKDGGLISDSVTGAVDGWFPFCDVRGLQTSADLHLGSLNLINRNAVAGYVALDNVEFPMIPEPASLVLLSFAGAGLLSRRRRVSRQ